MDLPLPDKSARTWATLAHLGGFGFVLFGFGQIVIPLVIWLIKREDHPFIDDQAKEALNFQISMTIYGLIVTVLICVVGWFIAAILAVVDVILIIIAAVRANAGERYRYPLTIRLL